MAVSDKLQELIEPLVTVQGLELFDIEHNGGILRVTVEREGGADMQAIAAITRSISRALDEHDPIAGRYTLEVSSPGLERALRTPSHFRWATGKKVSVKTVPTFEGDRRLTGTITDADDDGFDLQLDDGDTAGSPVHLDYSDIEKARTVFEWGGAPKPGSRGDGTGRKPNTTKTKTTKTTKRAKAS